MLFVFVMFISFGIFPVVKADSKGYITGDDVFFRSGAGTNFATLDTLNVGDEVTVKIIKIDDRGKVSLTIKGVTEEEAANCQ